MTSSLQTILTCNSRVLSAKALAQVVQFVYTGDVDTALCASQDIKHAAEFLAIPDLYSYMEKLERVVDGDIRKSLRRENDEVQCHVYEQCTMIRCSKKKYIHEVISRIHVTHDSSFRTLA